MGPESEERRRRGVCGCLRGAGAGRAPRGRPAHSPTCSRRLFTVYPSTKVYFKHLGFCPDEAQLLTHGQRMLEAVGVAVRHMDNLRAALSPLADLHAQVLRVDPSNFPVSPPGAPQGSRARSRAGLEGNRRRPRPFIRPFSRSC